MAKRIEKTVLFLGTLNFQRSRFAEILFNSVAGKMGLPWRAVSRGLDVEVGVLNVGPMSRLAIDGLEQRGLHAVAEYTRSPLQLTKDDLDQANYIVAMNQTEHRPLIQGRLPEWLERIEFWNVGDETDALAQIEREVNGLAARLIFGGKREEPAVHDAAKLAPKAKKEVAKSAAVVRVGRETKGRRGKGVTIVSDVPLDEVGLRELATRLKNRCGTGGTVKDGRIEIQGDQRDRLIAELEGMGYRVKRVGG